MTILRPFLLCVLLLLVTSCADPRTFSFSTIEQHYLTGLTPTTITGDADGAVVRQSFMPTHDGFHRVALTLAVPNPAPAGDAIVQVQDENQAIVYEQAVPLNEITSHQPRLFVFDVQPDSALRLYTVEVQLPNGVAVATDTEERYNGRLSVDGAYQNGDLLLEWGYKPTLGIVVGDGLTFLQKWGLPFLINALLWTVPGLALLAWLRRGEADSWSIPMLIGAAWAIGGALLVLLPMVAWWVGIPLGTWAVWLLLVGSAMVLVWASRRGQPFGVLDPLGGTGWLYLGILGLVLLSRVVVIHALNSPLWGDSVHHTLITQLLLDNGGIFSTYEPYLPLAPFTYHTGFHLLSAWLGWSVLPGQAVLSGMDATLIGGQWQNVMAVAMVGLLTEGLVRRAGRPQQAVAAGLIAVLVAGLLSTMPAFYVNWGRYTQLAGQIFLPPALLWSFMAWQPHTPRRWILVTVLMVSALALTHYRVLILYAAALPYLLGAIVWQERGTLSHIFRSTVVRVLVSGVATIAIILPWYWKLQESVIIQRTQVILSASSLQSDYIAESNPFGDLTQYVPMWFWGAAAVALLLLLLRRHLIGWLMGAWVALLFLVANPSLLRLPGTGLVDNFMLQIALYIPLAVLVGAVVGELVEIGDWGWRNRKREMGNDNLPTDPLPREEERTGMGRFRFLLSASRVLRPVSYLGTTLILTLGVWGVWQQSQLVETRWYSFLTDSDWRAARWIEENTAPESVFHVNGFFAYYDTTVAGSDGGEWLPLIAGRETTVPPMIYAHEAGIDPNYRADVNDRYRQLENAETEPTALAAAMREVGVEYIYIGGQQGMVGKPIDDTPMNPLVLANSGMFDTVYTDDFVWIFRLK
jgi:hypothetical protein